MKEVLKKYGNYIAIACVVLMFVFWALPEQFIRISSYHFNGYQFMFGAYFNDTITEVYGGGCSGMYIFAFVLIVLAIPQLFYEKKSSAFGIVSGIMLLIVSIVFFATQGWACIIFKKIYDSVSVLWVAYVNAVLMLIAGGVMLYCGIIRYQDEKRNLYSKSSYSYINKK